MINLLEKLEPTNPTDLFVSLNTEQTKLTVKTKMVTNVSIYNTNGLLVMSIGLMGKLVEIDITEIPNGAYTVTSGVDSARLLINRKINVR